MVKHTKVIPIERIKDDERYSINDTVIEEFPFTIHVNSRALVTLLCSPLNLDYLALGFLESEGFIEGKKSVDQVEFDPENGSINVDIVDGDNVFDQKSAQNRTLTTGCGKGTTFHNYIDVLEANPVKSRLTVSPLKILELVGDMEKRSQLFLDTGAVHVSTLASASEIIFMHEDIGRHNALDKLFGECIMKDVPYDDKIIVTTGRISSEMLIKCAKRKIPILISRSAATGLAVELAKKAGITLVGFVRGTRMNIYANGWRIMP